MEHEDDWKQTLTCTELQTDVEQRQIEAANKMKLVEEEAILEVKESKRIAEEETERNV